MKVIIDGKIIETGFILSIEKYITVDWAPCNFELHTINLKISMYSGYPIIIIVGSVNNGAEDYEYEMGINKKRAEAMIEFLDHYSDTPNLPYPEFK